MALCVELDYKYQNYKWGKLGKDSKVAELAYSGGILDKIDNNTPYAEVN